MKTVRLGIVGIGNMGSAHLSCVAGGQVPGLTAVAVCDTDEEKLKTANQRFPTLQLYTDYAAMLRQAQLDAVLIATPHPMHAAMAIAAFEAGLHVVLEKPADISVSQAQLLNRAARESGKVFCIKFNQRTNPLFQKARALVQSGALGALKRSCWTVTNWYRTQAYYDSGSWRATWAGEGGGVLLNQAPHNLDLWQWVCGMPCQVTGFCDVANFHDIEVEDDAPLFVRYPNGATGVFITSTGDYPGTNRLEVSGTKGRLVLENGLLKHWQLSRDEREVCRDCAQSSADFPWTYAEYENSGESGHRGILENFTAAVLRGEALLSPGAEGIYELTLSNAAYLSAWKGSIPVALPMDAEEFDRLLAQRAAASQFKDRSDSRFSGAYEPRWQVRW